MVTHMPPPLSLCYLHTEDDPLLDEEDKALARFQVHRIKEAKKATKFALSGDDAAAAGGRRGGRGSGGVTLTHGGISLEELEELNSRCGRIAVVCSAVVAFVCQFVCECVCPLVFQVVF
jgi:hypothetical protein